jgi:hypothetical protein
MFKRLLESIGKRQLSWSRKIQRKDVVIDYSNFFVHVKTALILLPEQMDNFGIAMNKQKDLIHLFPGTQLFYVIREKYLSLVPDELQKKMIPIRESDLTAFGLPGRHFLKNELKTHFDIIIDLNAEFDLVSTYISNKTAAMMRICLCHPQRDPFYNLQVCIPNDLPLDQKINIMIKYISQFIAPASHSPQYFLPVTN